jgi:hypothetical protein
MKTEYDTILNRLKSNIFRAINYRTGLGQSLSEEGATHWNDDYYTINIPSGLGPVLQTGQELYTVVFNNTGAEIKNGKAVRLTGTAGGYPSISLARADSFETLTGAVRITTMDIPDNSVGIVTQFGRAQGINTSGFSPGALYVSPTTAGDLTSTRPSFPNYAYIVGGVEVFDSVDGVISVEIISNILDTFDNFWNGTFRESFDFRVSSNGTTITGTLTPANGHPNMTMVFSDGLTELDTDPGATITLTPGTDTIPQTNYVYIPQSTKVLTVSTSGWPTSEHIRVAELYLQSASTTQEDGAFRNQNWNDEIQNTNTNQGHESHIGQRIRAMDALYDSGALAAITGTTSNVYVNVAAGKIFQMHLQDFPIYDMTEYTIDAVSQGSKTFTISGDGDLTNTFPNGRTINVHASTGNNGIYTVVSTSYNSPDFVITVEESIPSSTADGTIGDDIHVVNDPTTPFRTTTNLNDITVDSEGNTLTNKYFSIVIWGVANKSGEPSHVFCNLPSGSYTTSEAQAVSDALGYTNYNIPTEFKGVGFLIARFTMRKGSGSTFTYNSSTGYQDLRGFIPNSTAGAGAGSSGITEFTGLTDTPSSYTGQANNILRVNTGETALDFSTDINIDSANFTTSGDITSTNTEVGSTGAIYLGDQSTDGSWRFIRSGNDLNAQRRESGTWVDKGGFIA